jgi:hypothetical protein
MGQNGGSEMRSLAIRPNMGAFCHVLHRPRKVVGGSMGSSVSPLRRTDGVYVLARSTRIDRSMTASYHAP